MIPVILSGGSGTRLWPVSRASYPKQFCEFYDQSFLKNTIERLKGFGQARVLTVESMQSLTIRALNELGIPQDHAIFEPYGKNTAPAIALMCHYLSQKGMADEVVGIFPADHIVMDQKAFESAVQLGVECAEKGDIVTLGIEPRYASTGYGYIEVKQDVISTSGAVKAHLVEGFREKPDAATAETFVHSGRHYWNAGMFIFKASVMIEKFKELLPNVWKKIEEIKSDLSNAKYSYANVESVSIDYGIMEKLERQVCIPCNIGWSDVGSWDELSRLSEEVPSLRSDSHAHVFEYESHANYVYSLKEKVVGFVGVEDLIVVDTPDALLISKKGESQNVKHLVDQMKGQGLSVATSHTFEMRPWGGYEVLSDSPEFKTKKITVDPGAQLSYQSHKKRSEHWTIVKGEAVVVLDDKDHSLRSGEGIFIPVGAKHRIRNVGQQPLVFVEVQTGSYFGEDDITRYEDDYNRV